MNVAILGGGYAGMAAAVTLAERQIPVTIYEAAAHLGGRARRVHYNGVALDNGLHVLIGACSEVLRLVRLVNSDSAHAFLRMPLDWRIEERFRLRVPALPAPLHFAAGLVMARGLGVRGRYAAARFISRLRKQRFHIAEDTSVAALLQAYRLDEASIRYLWRPLCVSALNTPIEEASARVFLNVLRDGLNASAQDSDLLVARHDLTALFPEPAAGYVSDRGGTILLAHTVTAVQATGDGFVVEARGAARAHTHVICALPPHRLSAATGRLRELCPIAETVARFRYQPIYSVYLQYRDPVRLPAPMIGIADGLAHWLFDRDSICGQRGLIAAVISAAGTHRTLTQADLAERVEAEVGQRYGPLPSLAWHRVIAEKRATFSCSVDLARPGHRTALRNFYIAGDYVASDYPATLEAAVRSGVQAAREITAAPA